MTTTFVLALASFTITLTSVVLWFRGVRAVRLPQRRSGYVAVWLTSAALALVTLVSAPGWLGAVLAVASLAISGLLLLTVAISAQRLGPNAIHVGDSIPAFTALTDAGTSFDSQALLGRWVLLKFFRGHW
ncbi:MAG: hypothetical protein AAF648_13405 [Pseudomonadota bacterium]